MKVKIDEIDIGTRLRENYELEGLKDSIERVGQLMPIAITKEKELKAGARRLFAMRELGLDKIEAYVIPSTQETLLIELEENNHRRALKWFERAKGLVLLQKILTDASPGGAFTLRDLAEYTGYALGSISEDLTLGIALFKDETLACLSRSEALRVAQDKELDEFGDAKKRLWRIVARYGLEMVTKAILEIQEEVGNRGAD